MDKKEFAVAALDSEYEIYVVYVKSVGSKALPSSFSLDVYLLKRSQISGLIAEEAPTKVPTKYLDFVNVFFLNLAFKLFKYTGINNHAIKLVDSQQPPYKPIYSLGPVELETFKAHIKTNLANNFIIPSKSPVGTPILFNQKSNNFFQLRVDYQGLNNLTIKNRYPLPLIGKLLDRLGRAKQFIQLDFASAYHQIRICKDNE